MNIVRKGCWFIAVLVLSASALAWMRYEPANWVQWQTVPEGVVFARNFMLPDDPTFHKLPGSMRLGDARAKPAPAWWVKVAKDFGIERTSAELPLVFCGDLTSRSGSVLTVVAQLDHKFSGDGFFSPGPEFWLKVATVDRSRASDRPVLVSTSDWPVGGLQYSRLYAGKKSAPGICQFRVESGTLGGTTVNYTSAITLMLENDGKVKVEKP